MSIRRVSATEAAELCASGYRYIDVRTETEYQAGHPVGAHNVPYLRSSSGGMVDNPDFLRVMALYPKDAPLLVGCASGKRSLRAVESLIASGWTDVVDLRPGYAGVRNPFGQVTEAGWAASGLPTEFVTPGGDYAELRDARGPT